MEDRREHSAKEVKWQLSTMRNDLSWIAFDEEIAEEVIKILEEKE